MYTIKGFLLDVPALNLMVIRNTASAAILFKQTFTNRL